MKKYLKIGIILVVTLSLLGFFISKQIKPAQEAILPVPEINKPAPDFTLKDIKGKNVNLQDFKGKVIYLKFWASWCKDCIKQVIPQRRLEESLNGNMDIVLINVSVDESSEAWKRSVERNKLAAVQLISFHGDDANINQNYGIDEIPRYIIIGKDGTIKNNNAPHPNDLDAEYFAQFIQ